MNSVWIRQETYFFSPGHNNLMAEEAKIMAASGRLFTIDEDGYSFTGKDDAIYGNGYKYSVENNELQKIFFRVPN